MNKEVLPENIILQGHITAPLSEISRIKKALITHTRLTLEETGCLHFSVIQNSNNPQQFDVDEVFVNQQAFDFHQARVKASPWASISQNVTRHYHIKSGK